MASYRQVHTKIWKDTWFIQLPPDDKLLFIYLFSNEQASVAGIYELPIMVIAFETGLGIEYVTDALRRFEEAGKVRYQDGIVWVVNLRKYNENPSPKVRVRIENDIALIPDSKIKTEYIQYHNGTDMVYIPELENDSEHEHEQEQEIEQEQEQEQEHDILVVAPKIQRIQALSVAQIEKEKLTRGEWEQLLAFEEKQEKPRKGLIGFINSKLANGKLTPCQSKFLAMFGAKRFKNPTAANTVLQYESKYGEEKLLQAAQWAANMQMDVGKAITSIGTALPTWDNNKRNGSGKGKGPQGEYQYPGRVFQ